MTTLNRRDFMKASSAAIGMLPLAGCVARPLTVRAPYGSGIPEHEAGTAVNDVHSQLNATRVGAIMKPRNVEALQAAIARAKSVGQTISIAGGVGTTRHYLNAGVIDDLHLQMAPIILGSGERLWDGLTAELEPVSARQTRLATHLHFKVKQ